MWPQERHDPATQDIASNTPDSVPSSRRTSPHRSHMPNTGRDEQQVYVLTLSLTPSISAPLDQLRQEYFPKHLNRTPAHITLFHALPHSQIGAMDADLKNMAARTKAYQISTGKPFRLRQGVAVLLDAGGEESQRLREELRERWMKWLNQQDRASGGWHARWTVMNKVEEEKKLESAFNTIRRILFEEVYRGKAIGFELWKYDAGGWEHVRQYEFHGTGKPIVNSGAAGVEEGYFEQASKSMGKEPRSPEALKKAGTRMADIWKTVTLAKKSSSREIER